MDFASLRSPVGQEEVFATYKEFRKSFYSSLSLMHYSLFKSTCMSVFEQVKTLAAANEQRMAAKILIGIKVLGHLEPTYFDDLMRMLLEILPVAEAGASDFAGFVIAKFCRKVYRKNLGFIQNVMAKCSDLLSQKKTMKQGSSIIRWLGRLACPAITKISQQFIDTASAGIFCKDAETREVCADALAAFLTKERKGPCINGIFKSAKALFSSKKTDEQHSVLIALAIVAKFAPVMFRNDVGTILEFAYRSMKSKEKMCVLAAVKLMVVVAPLDPVGYRSMFADKVNSIIWSVKASPDVVRESLPMFDTFPDTLTSVASDIVEVAKTLLSGKAEDHELAYLILLQLMEAMPLSFAERTTEIVSMISNAPLDQNFLKVIPILKSSNKIWREVQPTVAAKLDDSVISLFFVGQGPSFSESHREALFARYYSLLRRKESYIQKYAPRALTKLRPYEDLNLVQSLLKLAITTTDPEVRLYVLKSFEPAHYDDLVYKNCLHMLQILANDDTVSVRKISILLLKKLAVLDPSALLPILRQLTLDALLALSLDNTLRAQMEVSKVIPLLLSASEMLTHVYFPVCLPIMMSFLTANLLPGQQVSVQQTYFEKQQMMFTATNYIKTIALTFRAQPSLLDNQCFEIIQLLLNIVEISMNKAVVLAILGAFQAILDYKGVDILPSFPSLFPILSALGARFESMKVFTALFKVLGRVGFLSKDTVQDQISKTDVDSNDLSQLGTTVLYQDWYLSVIATALLSIGEEADPKALKFHAMQVLAVSLNSKSEHIRPLFNTFVHYILHAIRVAPPDETDHYFSLFQSVISQPSDWFKSFSAEFADLILWLANSSMLSQALDMIPAFVRSVKEAFSPYMPPLISMLLDKLFDSLNEETEIAQKILFTFSVLTPFAQDYVVLIVQKICDIIMNSTVHDSVVVAALNTLQIMIVKSECSALSSQLFRLCKHCLQMNNENVKSTVTVLLSVLGTRFEVFRSPSISTLKDASREFEDTHSVISFDDQLDFANAMFPLNLNENVIVENSYCHESMLALQWKDWMTNFVLCVIGQSPSQVIKSCHGIAERLQPFAMKIFYPSFLSCWNQMSEYSRTTVSNSFSIALCQTETPLSVLVTLVGLAEFLERVEQHLIIPYVILAKAAKRAEKLPFAYYCAGKAIAKLSTKPMMISTSPNAGINRKPSRRRSQPMQGSPSDVDIENSSEASTLELGGGTDSAPEFASDLFSIPSSTDSNGIPASPLAPSLVVDTPEGIHAAEVALLVMSDLSMDADMRGLIASVGLPMTPALAEQLHDWRNAVRLYSMSDEGPESFYHFLHGLDKLQQWDEIAQNYDSRFSNLPATIKSETAVIFADAFFHLQNWSMFEYMINIAPADSLEKIVIHATANVMRHKSIADIAEKGFEAVALRATPLFAHGYSSVAPFLVVAQQLIELSEFQSGNIKRWSERDKLPFHLYQPLYEMRILLTQDVNEVRKYLKLSRKNDEWETHDLYCNMFPDDSCVRYERVLSLWKHHQDKEAFALLDSLIESLSDDHHLKSRAICKKAQFLIRGNITIEKMLEAAAVAAKSDTRKSYSLYGWLHSKLYNLKEGDRAQHAVHAIEGFAKCPGLPEAQQLASMLFRSGKFPEVFEAVEDKLRAFPSDLWLQMLPQISSQLSNRYENIRMFVKDLMRNLLKNHHHRVIFCVLFMCMFGSEEEKDVSKEILQEFQCDHPEIVEAAEHCYKGFLSACTTRAEEWLEVLAKSSDALKQNDADTVRATFDAAVKQLDHAETVEQAQFAHHYSNHICTIAEKLKVFYQERTRKAMEVVYGEMKTMFRAIKTENDLVTSLSACDVAPVLGKIRNVNIAVPGTYAIDGPLTTIQLVCNSVDVFNSKQRPKRVTIVGSDGVEYFYLLKGREDLRLDERAMQFFSLINAMIRTQIVTYFVMPLSKSGGLIQWINDTDTISKLVKEYRNARGIPVDVEARKMSTATHQNFDSLTPIQRLEALQVVAEATSDSVLADILWLKSKNPEVWLRKVSTFSKSCALMSIVGYIIGLGDRHPSNLMIHRQHGTVIHIDLGDCFEVTRNRLLFPEVIPFRMTRFMVRTLGPGGVNGQFNTTCCNVLKIIRRRRESVMAVLEIFAYAPIEIQGLKKNEGSEERIIKTISRISDKLSGNDFEERPGLNSEKQVAMLIRSATDPYNFAHLYRGWNPLW